MRKSFNLILLSVFLWTGVLQAQTIKIATDENKWYPYSYEEKGVSMGLHIDIAILALANLGYTPSLHPLPWKRCLASAKQGEYDAVISASYKPERAGFLNYPPDASSIIKSDFRITQVEYSIVTNINDSYEFDGNVKNLPHPIMAPLGYSVVDDLRKEGISVDEMACNVDCRFGMLKLSQKGCIVTPPQVANMIMTQPAFKGKFYISKTPFKSKSYFLVFSQKSSISNIKQKTIWGEIKRIRENDILMKKLLKKY